MKGRKAEDERNKEIRRKEKGMDRERGSEEKEIETRKVGMKE